VGVAFWLPAVANHALVRTTAAVSGWAEQSRQAIRGLISGSEDLKKAPPFHYRRAGHPKFKTPSHPRATRLSASGKSPARIYIVSGRPSATAQ
jgi:hypothetical protein